LSDTDPSQSIIGNSIPEDDCQAVIIMCTSYLATKHKTLKIQGHIGHLTVIAMIDSGSIHSFIHPTIVQSLSLPVSYC
jgi:hypothetical protein